jgi:hypothetical protein
MREIRQLPKSAAADMSLGKTRDWSFSRGILFATGVLVSLIACGALAYFGWQRSKAIANAQRPEMAEINFDLDLMQLPLNESWELWSKVFRGTELAQRRTPKYLFYRQVGQTYRNYMLIAGSFLLVGIVAAAAALTAGRTTTHAT